MEPTQMSLDDGKVDIRAMDMGYVIADDEKAHGCQVEIGCAIKSRWPNPPYVAYATKLIDAYGMAGIMAWHGKTLVGFMPVITLNCGMPPVPHCVSVPIDDRADAIAGATPTPFAELHPKVLRVQCLSVAGRLRRKGIGGGMARHLVGCAREQGWERIQGWAFADANIDDSYRWLPSIQFWERAGFSRGEACAFDRSDPATNKPGFMFSVDLTQP